MGSAVDPRLTARVSCAVATGRLSPSRIKQSLEPVCPRGIAERAQRLADRWFADAPITQALARARVPAGIVWC